MSRFSAAEAELLLNAAFAFLGGKLGDFDCIYDHGVGIMGFSGREIGERVVGLVGGFRVPPGDVIGSLPLIAFLYKLSMVEGTVSMDMMRRIKGGGIPVEKYPIRTLASEMLARAMWFLKVETYSTREGEYELFFAFFCMCLVDNQEMVFPVTSWCLNAVLNFVIKSAKVPRVNAVPEMALWRKVEAQVRADPFVMYKRVKVICFSSVS